MINLDQSTQKGLRVYQFSAMKSFLRILSTVKLTTKY